MLKRGKVFAKVFTKKFLISALSLCLAVIVVSAGVISVKILYQKRKELQVVSITPVEIAPPKEVILTMQHGVNQYDGKVSIERFRTIFESVFAENTAIILDY